MSDEVEAIHRLYERHAGAVFSLAQGICGPQLAAEATEAAFLSAWRARGNGGARTRDGSGWLLAIARERALELARARGIRSARIVEQSTASQPRPGHADDGDRLQRLLGEMPAEQRRVIELAYFGGLDRAEIAARLGIPAAAVDRSIGLGLAFLRTGLGEARP